MAENTSALFVVALHGVLTETVGGDPDYAEVSVVIVPEGTSALIEAVSLFRPPRPEPIANPAGSAEGRQEHAAIGQRRRNDMFTLESSLWVKAAGRPDQSSATFRAAMSRASGLLDHVISALRDRIGSGDALDVGQTISAIVSRYEYRPASTPEGWVVICDFDIDVTVRVT